MRKLLAVFLSALLLLGSISVMSSCTESTVTPTETSGGKTLRISVWNEEFKERFEKYFEGFDHMPDGVKVEFVINASEGNVYQTKLDEALKNQASQKPDDRIDIFLVESDYATKYTSSKYALDVVKDVGLTEDDLKNQYQYTKDVVTYDGKLKGVSWQACPMGFMYRRSMAKAVWDTDDPDTIQAKIDTWAKFDAVAAQLKAFKGTDNKYASGISMLSGFDDDFRVFANNRTKSWVDGNKIQIDDQINKWIDQTKLYTDNKYNNKASLWSAESVQGMANDGNVFGYFGPSWFMDFCFMKNTLADANKPAEVGNGGYGDWAMVKGPATTFWGGTWICAAAGTDNLDLVKSVMKIMTCNENTLIGITNDYGDFTNNVPAMTKIAEDTTYGYAFLGGENHIAVLLDTAKNIKLSTLSIYDQTMTEQIQLAFKDYFNGVVTKEKAWENFYTAVQEKHPELTK